jgi:hypothetical protein
MGLALLFLGLMGLTLRRLLQAQDWSLLSGLAGQIRLPWLAAAGAMMVLFFLCEGANYRAALELFGPPPPYRACVRYAATGFFFSAVTPSASGGQPMALAAMGRDGHKAAPSALALLTVFLCYQGGSFLWAGLGAYLHWDRLTGLTGGLAGCFLLGLGLSVGLALGLIGAVCSPRLLPFLFQKLLSLVRRVSPARSEKIALWGRGQWDALRRCLGACRARPGALARMFAVAVVQLGAYHSVPLWVGLALGGAWASPVSVLSLQAVLYLAVSSLPLPGGVGLSEEGFLAVFQGLVPPDLLPAAALLSRGISFYLPLALTGVFLLLFLMKRKFTSTADRAS